MVEMVGYGGIWWIWHHREGFRMPVLLHDVRLTGRLSHRRSRHWRQSLQTRLLTWFVAVVLVCFGVWLTYVPAKLAPRSAPPPLTRRLPRWGAPRPATRHEPLLPDGSARLRRRTGFSRPRFSAIQRCLAFLLVDALATASDAGKCATGVCPSARGSMWRGLSLPARLAILSPMRRRPLTPWGAVSPC